MVSALVGVYEVGVFEAGVYQAGVYEVGVHEARGFRKRDCLICLNHLIVLA